MNKYYKRLWATAIVCSAVSGLVASEKREKPFFDKPTQEVVKTTAKYYGLSYVGLYGAGTIKLLKDRSITKQCCRYYGRPSTCWCNKADIKQSASVVYRSINRTIPFTAPLVFGTALVWHKYKQNMHVDKE